MQARLWRLLYASILPLSLVSIGCDADGTIITPTGAGTFRSPLVTIDVAPVSPVFLSGASCRANPAFRTGVSVTVLAGQELFFRGVGFHFVDRFGVMTLPVITPLFGSTLGLGAPMPVPLPSSGPVPIPGGFASLGGVPLLPGSPFTHPFSLQFACGVAQIGTLFVAIETTDRHGRRDVARKGIRIGN